MSEESGHWYTQAGEPCHQILAKNGNMRPVNLRWDRKLRLVPSVTTVIKIIATPQLTTWMVKQGILAALTLPRIEGEPEEDYLDRVMDDSKQQAKLAAEEGSRVHNATERSFKGLWIPDRYVPHVDAIHAEIAALFPEVDDWVSEKTFAHPSGFGGSCDLNSPSTGIVVDFKGKDGDFTEVDDYGKLKKLAWDQHWQLAGYQNGLLLPRARGANIFFSRTHPGKVASHVWSQEDMEQGWQVFAAALALWKNVKGYDGAY